MIGFVPALLRRFPATTLPWVIFAAAVVGYSTTLNPWVSFHSVEQVARISGWSWEPELRNPLYFLLTLPLRWMPAAWVPAALNIFNAVCAAAILGLLARSVALLPHNRTHEQRERERDEFGLLSIRSSWMPPLLAALVCGLQLTFWEHATMGTRDMVNLLVFAYVIRCLLEFRIDERQHWLSQAAFLWGAGMANHFAMVGFLPLFVGALVWMKRLQFFNTRFLVTMAAWGLAGASLYLLLPLLHAFSAEPVVGFWQSLKYNLVAQKNVLLQFPRKTLLTLSLTSIVPVVLISIRWSTSFGDNSRIGSALASFMFHLVHAVFLVSCLWIAFDPPVSPRNRGMGIPFLTFYYLGALAIGYFAGYFLLVFGVKPSLRARVQSRYGAIGNAIVVGVWLVAAAAVTGLFLKNLPQIQTTNSPMVRALTSLTAESLPDGPTVALSDDAVRSWMLQSLLAQRPGNKDVLFLHTGSLKAPPYQALMASRHPDRWPVAVPTNLDVAVRDMDLVQLILKFSESNHVCYLHPSFGYYFEFFSVKPEGLIFRLQPLEQGTLLPPPLSEEKIEANRTFWNDSAQDLVSRLIDAKATEIPNRLLTPRDRFILSLHAVSEPNRTASVLALWCSRALTYWGVTLQRAGHLEEAGDQFATAQKLNADNVVAGINLKYNVDLQAGRSSSVTITKAVEDEFGKYRGWEQVITANGPFDEPKFCEELAKVLLRGRLYREALQEWDRVRTLSPSNLVAQLWFARISSSLGHPDVALETVDYIRARPDLFPVTTTNQLELTFVEASAHAANQDPAKTQEVIDAAITADPENMDLLAAALQLYLNNRLFTNAIEIVDRQLQLQPDDPAVLVNKGFVFIRLKRFTEAAEVLTRALEIQPGNTTALFNRAIALLRTDQLDKAKQDYEALLLEFPNAFQVFYGLGEIAYRTQDTNAAMHNYQLYLTNAPPGTAEREEVETRLRELTGGQE